jgi:hypothetical protein
MSIIQNPVDKKIYDYIINDIKTNGKNYSILTNNVISVSLSIPQNTVRDKVIRLAKKGYLLNLCNHWDENGNYFLRKILKGNIVG